MPQYNVLFLCTGNSARSIMAEAIMNRNGMPTSTAYSAGSHPSGAVRPEALSQIANAGLSTENFRSKSWNEFSKPDSPSFDFVFTVCDNAANEVCPLWPGQPMTAHWGIPDPTAVQGTPEEIELAFSQAFTMLDRRISPFSLSSARDARHVLFAEGNRQHWETVDARRCDSTLNTITTGRNDA
jgi:arsenate reductase